MRDPSVIQGNDGLFHMVWTVSWGEKGIGYSSSKDLINWAEQQYLPVMEDERPTRNCWAPELFYDEATNRYLIFWASTIPGEFAKGQEQKYNHRLYYVTTRDFKTFSESKLFYDHGFSVIDAAVIREGKKYVMFLKDETDKPNTPEKNIRIATSDKPQARTARQGNPSPATSGQKARHQLRSTASGSFTSTNIPNTNTVWLHHTTLKTGRMNPINLLCPLASGTVLPLKCLKK
jgi:beta-xylosidase